MNHSRRTFLGCSAGAALATAANAQNVPGGGGGPNAAALEKLLAIPSGQVDAVLDTDTYNEIDDQYAVAYALQSSDRIRLEAIYAAPYLNARSTSAGDGMEKSYDEILRILKFLGHQHSNFVFRGSNRFFASAQDAIDSPAAKDLVRRAMQPRNGPLYVLTIGCPANVSSAILMEPKIKDRIVVVWLGGTTHEWPSAREFNLQQDIHSSRVLFDSRVPLVQIPTKNVSEHLRTTVPELEKWVKGRSKVGDYFFQEFLEYAEFESKQRKISGPYPYSKVVWDISVIAWLIEPKWVPSKITPSPMLADGFLWKQDAQRHPIRVATNCQRDPIFYDLFEKLAKTGR